MEKITAKRLLALLLALVMALSLLPAIALAEGTGEQVFTADRENLQCEKGVWIAARAENNVLTFPNRNWCRWEEGKLTIPCDPIGTDTLYFAVDRNDGLTIGGKVQTPVGTLKMTFGDGSQPTCNVYAFPVPENTTEYTVTRTWWDNGVEHPEEFALRLDRTPLYTGETARYCWGIGIFTALNGTVLSCDERVAQSNGGVMVPCALVETDTVYFAGDLWGGLEIDGAAQKPIAYKKATYRDDSGSPVEVLEKVYRLSPVNGKDDYTVARTWQNGEEKHSEEFTLRLDRRPVYGGEGSFCRCGVWLFSGCSEEPKELRNDEGVMIPNRNDEGLTVNCNGTEEKTVYLAVENGSNLNVTGGTLSKVDGIWVMQGTDNEGREFTEVCDIYALRVKKPQEGTQVNCKVERSWSWWENNQQQTRKENFSLLFDFDCKLNGNGEDTTYWKEYTSRYGKGSSKITLQINELQAQVLTLPEEINENNELIIRLHNAKENNEAVWRELASNKWNYLLSYYFDSVEPAGTAKPQVRSTGGVGSIDEALTWIQDHTFQDYNPENPGMYRGNGIFFAWVKEETDRTVILPQKDEMTSAWEWKYGDGKVVQDGVIVKIVFDADINNAFIVERNELPTVAENRLQMVEHKGFDTGEGAIFSGSYKGDDGVFTYEYIGDAITAEGGFVSAAIEKRVAAKAHEAGLLDGNNIRELNYPLLEVKAPAGYSAVGWSTPYEGRGASGDSMTLSYPWCGVGSKLVYTLIWSEGENETYEEYREQVTVSLPAAGSETWMDHINEKKSGGTNCAKPVPNGNVVIQQAGMDAAGALTSYQNGLLWTDFAENGRIDVDKVLGATYKVKVPEGAVAYRICFPGDGNDDAAFNESNRGLAMAFQEDIDNSTRIDLQEGQEYVENDPAGGKMWVEALLSQQIGEIRYYYSADRGTNLCLIKWIFDKENEDKNPRYEYLQLDTQPYYCQWKVEVKEDSEVTGKVDKPTATTEGLKGSDIQLVSRTHPQNMADKFFFELEMVEKGSGNTYIIPNGEKFTIILPYEFMGVDKNGNPWTYETARRMKEAKIQHYDKNFKQLKGNAGVLKGVFTERGIEFEVDSFSPFLLVFNDKGTPGGSGSSGGGSSSGGSSGGGSSAAPAEPKPAAKPVQPTQPVQPAPETNTQSGGSAKAGGTQVPLQTQVSGSTVTVASPDMALLAAAAKAANAPVELDLSQVESEAVLDAVTLPAEAVAQLAAADSEARLSIVLGEGASIELSAKTLHEKLRAAGGDTLRISIEKALAARLNDAQAQAAGARPVFDVAIYSGDTRLSYTGGEITLRVPYALLPGETPEGLRVYFLDDAGEKELCQSRYEAGFVTWTTSHLSLYMVDYEAPETGAPAEAPAQAGGIGLWIVLGVAALTAAVVITAVAISRKRRRA